MKRYSASQSGTDSYISVSLQSKYKNICNLKVLILFHQKDLSANGQRLKYYLAWVLAEIVNNASGFGFNGYDSDGNAKWDLLTNIKILKLEVK